MLAVTYVFFSALPDIDCDVIAKATCQFVSKAVVRGTV